MALQPPTVVRRIDPDQPDVQYLLHLSDAHMASLYPVESSHLAHRFELKQADCTFLGAFWNEVLVGCGGVRILADEGHYGEIKRVFVVPEARRQGIAPAILLQLEIYLVACGIDIMRLETGIFQPEALQLYLQAGYTQREPFGAYRPDPLSVFMEKRLR